MAWRFGRNRNNTTTTAPTDAPARNRSGGPSWAAVAAVGGTIVGLWVICAAFAPQKASESASSFVSSFVRLGEGLWQGAVNVWNGVRGIHVDKPDVQPIGMAPSYDPQSPLDGETQQFLSDYAAMIKGKPLSPEAPRVDPAALEPATGTRTVTLALDGPQALTLA